MKIAICGLFDFRNEIITRLPGKAILSVYFEFSSLFQKRIFDFTPVFPYQDVSSFKETIDFFVISYKEGSTLQSAIHTLKEAGIPSSKIILYSVFRAST